MGPLDKISVSGGSIVILKQERNERGPKWLAGIAAHHILARQMTQEVFMDWDRVEGNWKKLKGSVKEKWGNLTDDDLDRVAGRRDQLEGVIQERYGLAKDQVERGSSGAVLNGVDPDQDAVAGKDLDAAQAALKEANARVAAAQKTAQARRSQVSATRAQAEQAQGGAREVAIRVGQLSPAVPSPPLVEDVFFQKVKAQ